MGERHGQRPAAWSAPSGLPRGPFGALRVGPPPLDVRGGSITAHYSLNVSAYACCTLRLAAAIVMWAGVIPTWRLQCCQRCSERSWFSSSAGC
jgi:hypothetical protein